MTPFFKSFLWTLCLKVVKIHFHGVLPLVHSGLQNTWILKVKSVKSEFFSVQFSDTHIKENKKPGFTLSIEIRTKFFLSDGLLGEEWNLCSKRNNPFHANDPFLYPLKRSENQRFSGVFRVYRSVRLA